MKSRLVLFAAVLFQTVGVMAQSAGRVLRDGVYYDRQGEGRVSVAKFYDRRRLVVPDSVEGLGAITAIGPRAAMFLGTLRVADLSGNIRLIGDYAFACCLSLRTLIVRSNEPPALGEAVFAHTDIGSCLLVVPDGSRERYKADGVWSRFGEIREMSAFPGKGRR